MKKKNSAQVKKTWKYKVRKPICRGSVALIPLTRGKEAIIDICDLQLVSGWNWSAKPSKCGGWYAVSTGNRKIGLHQFLMGRKDGLFIDHKDGNGLNCRRKNMRYVTHRQNTLNQKNRRGSASKFKGVTKRGKCWRARICMNGVRIFLGDFLSEIDAAKAYDAAATRLFGEFAFLNLPRGSYAKT